MASDQPTIDNDFWMERSTGFKLRALSPKLCFQKIGNTFGQADRSFFRVGESRQFTSRDETGSAYAEQTGNTVTDSRNDIRLLRSLSLVPTQPDDWPGLRS